MKTIDAAIEHANNTVVEPEKHEDAVHACASDFQDGAEWMRKKARTVVLEMMKGLFRSEMPQKLADEFYRKLDE